MAGRLRCVPLVWLSTILTCAPNSCPCTLRETAAVLRCLGPCSPHRRPTLTSGPRPEPGTGRNQQMQDLAVLLGPLRPLNESSLSTYYRHCRGRSCGSPGDKCLWSAVVSKRLAMTHIEPCQVAWPPKNHLADHCHLCDCDTQEPVFSPPPAA